MSDDQPLFTSMGEDTAVVKYIVKNASANIRNGNHPCCSDKCKTISVMFFLLFQGFGVFTERDFKKGEFILEYAGDTVDLNKIEELEKMYNERCQGSYLYVVGKF